MNPTNIGDPNKVELKKLLKSDVRFTRYFDGKLWYRVDWDDNAGFNVCRVNMKSLEFPVPISDIGGATFLAQDKAILFMRYIRIYLDELKKAYNGVDP
jgi:hypothetical protein